MTIVRILIISFVLFEGELSAKEVYATVRNSTTRVFLSEDDARINLNESRRLEGIRFFLSVDCPQTTDFRENDQTICRMTSGEFVRASDLKAMTPSEFSGVEVSAGAPLNFGWGRDALVVRTNLASSDPDNLKTLPLNSLVWIENEVQHAGKKWVKIRDSGWARRSEVRRFHSVRRHSKIPPDKKWIHVRISEQTLAAYDGDQLVYATLISSGRTKKETKRGLFRIYNRLILAPMAGDLGDPDYYFFDNIPQHLYFYKNLALHGAYARERFGNKGSHGCINLSLKDSNWIWKWTGGDAKVGKLGPKKDPPIEGDYVWIDD